VRGTRRGDSFFQNRILNLVVFRGSLLLDVRRDPPRPMLSVSRLCIRRRTLLRKMYRFRDISVNGCLKGVDCGGGDL
jgi:hypothetical protein